MRSAIKILSDDREEKCLFRNSIVRKDPAEHPQTVNFDVCLMGMRNPL